MKLNNISLTAIRNYRPIDARLATSGQPSVEQLRSIADAGYAVVINLALHDDPRYSLADERGTVQSLGLQYIHIPVQFSAPTEANLLAFFEAMQAHRDARVWVHCAANWRVAVFLGLYRIIVDGWTEERAFELLHSLWTPDEVWSAFIAATLSRSRS